MNPTEPNRTAAYQTKERIRMPQRLSAILASTLGAAVLLFAAALPTATASAAESAWWEVLSAARPSNLPLSHDASLTQKVTGTKFLSLIFAARVEVADQTIGCLGAGSLAPFGGPSAQQLCEDKTGFPAAETATEFEAMLESVYGAGEVEVSGGPAGTLPFNVESPWGPSLSVSVLDAEVPGLGVVPAGEGVNAEVTSEGSGLIAVSFTNLGDAPVDATSVPLILTDELPPGVSAYEARAQAGRQGIAGPVDCAVDSVSKISCSFEGELPAYEAIEVEVFVAATSVSEGQGTVEVSGGDAPAKRVSQSIGVSTAPVQFGLERFEMRTEEEGGASVTDAGVVPFQTTTTLQFSNGPQRGSSRREALVDQPALPRNTRVSLPAGLVGSAVAAERCPMSDFLNRTDQFSNTCPDSSAIGVASVTIVEHQTFGLVRMAVPIFNLPPEYGEPARFGFMPALVPVVIDTAVDPDNEYKIVAEVKNAPQTAQLLSATVVLWGAPGDSRHDSSRGWRCAFSGSGLGPCTDPPAPKATPFLRMPVSCNDQLDYGAEVEPWNTPLGSTVSPATFSAAPLLACNQVPFAPTVSSTLSSTATKSSSGLNFQLNQPRVWPAAVSQTRSKLEAQPKRIEVNLPEGVTVNPAVAGGLATCSPSDYRRERYDSAPGQGCPEASKIGSVKVSTPLLDEEAEGALYQATPYDNPFDSLIALYLVARIPERGILAKQAGVVKVDPVTGRLRSTFDNLPQLPYSTFKVNFREGPRAPLVTPPRCGSYQTVANFVPWSASNVDNPGPGDIFSTSSPFSVNGGPGGSACPSSDPFNPAFTAGSQSNAAGHYSPFNVRVTRDDGEQEIRKISVKLPPGVTGKLAGIEFCSDAAIANARSREHDGGGAEEQANPSCPAGSQIGKTLVGSGVGSMPVYVPGKLYLAGPYDGAPLSVVAITPAVVGPFDVGTVVVREALRVDPITAEVTVDAGPESLPRIIDGIPVQLRDVRIETDRSQFTLNPTSCEPSQVTGTIGSDGQNADVSSRYQAASCASLGFKPRLSLRLKGGVKRGKNPALEAVYRPRPGDANASRIAVRLPHSEFLDQSHIRTVCTRVQFNAGAGNGSQCPRGAIYGRAKVFTPLLSDPLEGPVFLRSSSNPLPDLVLAMHGLIDFNAVGRIDSVNAGIRNTFDFVPDVPITKVVLNMRGGKKGLLVNSSNICKGKHRAVTNLLAHNGRRSAIKPLVQPKCPKAKKRKSARHRSR